MRELIIYFVIDTQETIVLRRWRDADCLPELDLGIWWDTMEIALQHESGEVFGAGEVEPEIAKNLKESSNKGSLKNDIKERYSMQAELDEEVALSDDAVELIREYKKGGFYKKLAILKYIRLRQASIVASKMESKRNFNLQTDILDPFSELRPQLTLLTKVAKTQDRITSLIYKVELIGKMTLILTISLFSLSTVSRIANVRQEYYLGRTLGGISTYIPQLYAMREVAIGAEQARIEMLEEYGGEAVLDMNQHIDANRLVIIAYQLSKVLAFLETQGVSHFDIKPENIVWDKDTSKIQLIDFGVSIAFQSDPKKIFSPLGPNAEKLTGFTNGFAAPEVRVCSKDLKGESIIPQKADVYSFGMTIWILMQGYCKTRYLSDMHGEYEHERLIQQINKSLIEENQCEWKNLLAACLNYCPTKRPTFQSVLRCIEELIRCRGYMITTELAYSAEEHAKFACVYSELAEYETALWHYEQVLRGEQLVSTDKYFSYQQISQLFNYPQSLDGNIQQQSVQIGDGYISLSAIPKAVVLDVARMYMQMGIDASRFSDYATALELGKNTEMLLSKLNNKDDMKAAIFFNNIGILYSSCKQYVKAIEYYKQAEDIHSQLDCIDGINVATIAYNLGVAYFKAGAYRESIEYSTKAQSVLNARYQHHHSDIAAVAYIKGLAYAHLQKYVDAISCYQLAKTKYTMMFTLDYIDVAYICYQIGNAYRKIGHNTSAIEYYKQAADSTTLAKNKQDPDIANLLCHLGDAYDELHEYRDAITYYQEAERIWIVGHGEEYPNLGYLWNQLGCAYYRLGDPTLAVHYFNRSANNLKNKTLISNVNAGIVCFNLGLVHAQRGNSNIAIALLSTAESMLRTGNSPSPHYITAVLALGHVHYRLSDFTTAVEYYERAKQLLVAKDGTRGPDTVSVYLHLGNAYAKLADYNSALHSYSKAQDIGIAMYGECETLVADACRKLGNVYSELHDYRSAIDYYQRASRIYIAKHANSQEQVGLIFANIGYAYSKLSDYLMAIEYYHKAASILIDIHGLNSVDIALLYSNIAVAYYQRHDCTTAIEYCHKAEHITICQLGVEHINTAMIYNTLGCAYSKLSDYTTAIEYYHKAESIIISVYGSCHTDVASVSLNTGNAYFALAEYSTAIEYYHKAEMVCLAIHGISWHGLINIFYYLGAAYLQLPDCTTAIDYFHRAEQVCICCYGAMHPDLALITLCLGYTYHKLGDNVTACEYYKRAEHITVEVNGERHIKVARLFSLLGSTARKLGDYNVSIQYYKSAEKILQPISGTSQPIQNGEINENPNNSDLATIYEQLGTIYDERNEYKMAIEYYKKAENIWMTAQDKHRPDLAYICSKLGAIASSLKDYSTALAFFKRAGRFSRAVYGNDHPEVATAFFNIGATCFYLEEYQSAVDCLTVAEGYHATPGKPNPLPRSTFLL